MEKVFRRYGASTIVLNSGLLFAVSGLLKKLELELPYLLNNLDSFQSKMCFARVSCYGYGFCVLCDLVKSWMLVCCHYIHNAVRDTIPATLRGKSPLLKHSVLLAPEG